MRKDCNKYIDKECLKLFDSGGIDNSSFSNNYLLPKIILHVALKNLAQQYKPLSGYSEDINNLLKY